MFNISKQGSSLLITSNDNSQFPWKDGQMSLPMNSVVYVIDESDYIVFKSASNNDILFTALIDEIQINGTNVTKDDFILQFDNVANSAGGGGGSASAGVNSINGFQGDLTLKSINGQSLIGAGNIEIEGGEGSTAGVEAINIGEEIQDWTQKTGIVPVYTSFYDGSYDVAIGGTSFYGLKPVDNSIVLENAGGTVNGNFRCGIKVNEDNFKTINGESIFGTGDITIEGGGSEPEQYIVSIEDFLMYTKEEPYKKLWLQYIDSSNKNEIITKEIILEWTGTQSEYDALGEYDDSITYNIIEG